MQVDNQNKQQIEKLQEIRDRDDWNFLLIVWEWWRGKTYLAKQIFKNMYVNKPEIEFENNWEDEYWNFQTKRKRITKREYIKQPYFISDTDFKFEAKSWNLKLKPSEEVNRQWYTLECLRRYNLVIYDDYGQADPTAAYFTALTNWLDYRIYRNKQTIITSNLSRNQIFERNPRIDSRIQYNSIVVEISWPDRRKMNQEVIKL